jgi:hypothetical protein
MRPHNATPNNRNNGELVTMPPRHRQRGEPSSSQQLEEASSSERHHQHRRHRHRLRHQPQVIRLEFELVNFYFSTAPHDDSL